MTLMTANQLMTEPEQRWARDTSAEEALSDFLAVRRRLLSVASRITRNAADAEDAVQTVWLRWQMTDRSVVRNAAAFLTTATARLAMSMVQSARERYRVHAGSWLHDLIDASVDPLQAVERDDEVWEGLHILLERLSPSERAAFVLREAFDYPYRKIADQLQLTEGNVRQLVSRARQHIARSDPVQVSKIEQKQMFKAFLAAAQHGEMTSLESLFAADDQTPGPAVVQVV